MPSIRLKLSTGDVFYKATGFDPETLSIRRYSLNGNDFYKAEVIDRDCHCRLYTELFATFDGRRARIKLEQQRNYRSYLRVTTGYAKVHIRDGGPTDNRQISRP